MTTTVGATVWSLGMHAGQYRAGTSSAIRDSRRLQMELRGSGQAAQGLQFDLFAAGFAGSIALRGLLKVTGDYEQEILRASQATNQGASQMGFLSREAMTLSRELRKDVTAAAALQKSVVRMGVEARVGAEGFTEMSASVAQAAAELATVTDLTDQYVAESLFRFILATSKTDEQFHRNILNARGFASAILFAGDSISAGTDDLVKFLTKFQLVAPMINLTEGEVIALAAAFANLEKNAPDRVTSSVLRLFSDELIDNADGLGKALGVTTSEIDRMRREDPVRLFKLLGQTVIDANNGVGAFADSSTDAARALHEMGFTNVRDKRTINAFTVSLKIFDNILEGVNHEIATSDQLSMRLGEQLDILNQRWSGFTSQVKRSAIAIGNVLMPVLKPLVTTLETLASIPERSPFAAALFGAALVGGPAAMAMRSGLLGPLVMTGGRGFGGPFGMYFAHRRRQGGAGGAGGALGGMLGRGGRGGARMPAALRNAIESGDVAAMRAAGIIPRDVHQHFVGGAAARASKAAIATEVAMYGMMASAMMPRATRGSLIGPGKRFRQAGTGIVEPGKRNFVSMAVYKKALDEANRERGRALASSPRAMAAMDAKRLAELGLIHRVQAEAGLLSHMGTTFGPGVESPSMRRPGIGSQLTNGAIIASLTPFGRMRTAGKAFLARRKALGLLGMHQAMGVRRLSVAQIAAGQGPRIGPMGRFGARTLGFAGGRMGAGLAGFMGRSMLGRAALGVTGPGAILGFVSMLHPVFEGLGKLTGEMRGKGSMVGAVAGSFEFLFKTLQLGTNILGLATDKIMDLFGLITKIPGVKQVFDLVSRTFGDINGTLDKANAFIDEQRGRGPVSPTTVNVDARSSRDATREQVGQTMKNQVMRNGGSAFRV